ncbi:exodeoxyribonuclease V subunit alpha [Pseudoalteromonas luteoviolacea]|uniref:exodeoxyribonuclease V subunit alpha n=1 Tax=Pseudoalteromonas luteoviolacea TaxID=43657 RepID=UPI001EEEE3E1|nr:exodeoxyribonuclease V subunit alpha [Pseudoalteromonas luteoviolacea]MCF6442751.1 exodeoxyribonuclease V subunit alpha [Pseudoalteromonas luteoviolacea]
MSQFSLDFTQDSFDDALFIEVLIEQRKVRSVDIALAKLLCDSQFCDVFYLILLVLKAEQNQHSCLLLDTIDWFNPFELNIEQLTHSIELTPFVDKDKALQALSCHQAVGHDKPIVLFKNQLYLARLANYEAYLAERFISMSQREINLDLGQLQALLNVYFPVQDDNVIDWQKVACAIAAASAFCVITGGPGTGKTTTVTKLLAILQSLYVKAPLNIKLVAPTGKAAARLSESIIGAKGRLALAPELADLIPEDAQTIHRLLGVIPHSNKYKHHDKNPLHVDLLIVDEASMVDLSLMSKLVAALPEGARLYLLGDKDQLASVDTGCILNDLCADLKLGQHPKYSSQRAQLLNDVCFGGVKKLSGAASQFQLQDMMAFLQQSHRFKSDSGIGQLASAVNNNDPNHLDWVIHQGFSELSLYGLSNESYVNMIERAANAYSEYLRAIQAGESARKIHKLFSDYQLLAAVREGPYGVNELNKRIEHKLAQQNLIRPYTRYYVGMPLMITQNDYQLKLFNGDIGIVLPDENGQLFATFIDEQGHLRSINPARLPSYELVYVMTIHKSQGSEFAHTAMILPPIQRARQGVNRQLVYTGITRAKNHLELICQPQVLRLAMEKTVGRSSGLRERLLKN